MDPSGAMSGGLFLAWQEGALGNAMRTSPLLYPGVEILHILGFVTLVGAIGLLDLRVLGLGRTISLEALARLTIPLAAAGLALAIAMGLLLFSADAAHVVENPSFRVKLVLIGLSLANIAAAHAGPWRTLVSWGAEPPVRARLHAAFSLLLWIAVILAGRLIAYF
jgi:hypothetical protein